MRDRGGRGARRAGRWSSRPFSRRRPGFPASARDAPTRGARTPSCLAYVCRPLGPTTCVLCRVANPLDFRAMDLSRLVSPGCGSPRAGPGRCASGCAPRLGAAGPGCPAPVIKRRLLGPGPELGTPAAGCPSCSLSGVRAGTRDRLLRGALGRVVWLPPPPRTPPCGWCQSALATTVRSVWRSRRRARLLAGLAGRAGVWVPARCEAVTGWAPQRQLRD